MADIHLGSHNLKSHGFKVARFHLYDWLIFMLLVAIEIGLNVIEPFHRFVGDQNADLIYPLKENTVPVWAVPVCTFFFIFILFFIGWSKWYPKFQDSVSKFIRMINLAKSRERNRDIFNLILNSIGQLRFKYFKLSNLNLFASYSLYNFTCRYLQWFFPLWYLSEYTSEETTYSICIMQY